MGKVNKGFELERRDVTRDLLGTLNKSWLPYSAKKDILSNIIGSLNQNIDAELKAEQSKYDAELKAEQEASKNTEEVSNGD